MREWRADAPLLTVGAVAEPIYDDAEVEEILRSALERGGQTDGLTHAELAEDVEDGGRHDLAGADDRIIAEIRDWLGLRRRPAPR